MRSKLIHLVLIVFLLVVVNQSSKSQTTSTVEKPLEMNGEQTKALIVAYQAMMTIPDLPKSKKKIQNYSVEISYTSATIVVHFVPKIEFNPHLAQKGGETKFGREMSYEIRRKDFKILKRLYYM